MRNVERDLLFEILIAVGTLVRSTNIPGPLAKKEKSYIKKGIAW